MADDVTGATFAKDDSEDLVSQDEESENWRGIGIALLVIAVICSLIVTSIVLLTPHDTGPRVKKERIRLDEILSENFKPRIFNGTWLSDDEFVFQDRYGSLVIFNSRTASQSTVISNVTYHQLHSDGYSLSPNRNFLLFRTGTRNLSSYSYIAQYHIFNISSRRSIPFITSDVTAKLRFARWGPSGSQLVYVFSNNIYYQAKVGDQIQPITQNGLEGVRFNGIPDWTYEGILRSNNAIWWLADGTMLAYASFDDTDISAVKSLRFGAYDESSNISPMVVDQRYPKPGTAIPKVSLWVVALHDPNVISKEVLCPKELRHVDHYLNSVAWVDSRKLIVTWSARAQNYSIISICSVEKRWECEKHFEESTTSGWVDVSEPPFVTTNRWHYFMILPVADGKAGNYRHVNMIDINGKGVKTILTHGRYDVTKIIMHRSDIKKLYYVSTLPMKRGQRHVFSVTDTQAKQPRHITCLTCNISTECLYNDAVFSPGGQFYILSCLGPGVPRTELRLTEENALVTVLETNSDIRSTLENRAEPQEKRFYVPLSSGFDAHVKVLLPPGLFEEEIIKYPMIVEVDASPGSQSASEKFQINWGSYLASRLDIIYVAIDGRGSGFYGDKNLHQVYRRLGTVEVTDQLEVISSLKNDLPYIDKNKIGIWGWGYGGYVTASALATDPATFACGISIAPVTNWRYYDVVYAEKYMQSPKPEDNYIGYEKANVNLKAANFKDKKFLLIHGTADEKVHIQHSMMLMKALIVAGMSYHTQLYPDESHALDGVQHHLYDTMGNFFGKCFAEVKKDKS